MVQERIFMTIRSSFFVIMHNTTSKKLKKRHLPIHKYFKIELRPKINILSVMEI